MPSHAWHQGGGSHSHKWFRDAPAPHSHGPLSEGNWRGPGGNPEDLLAAGVEDVDEERVHVERDAAEGGHAVHGQDAVVPEQFSGKLSREKAALGEEDERAS